MDIARHVVSAIPVDATSRDPLKEAITIKCEHKFLTHKIAFEDT